MQTDFMATVQEILDTESPTPSKVYRPSRAVPIGNSTDSLSRDDEAYTYNPISKQLEKRDPGKARIWGVQSGLKIDRRDATNYARNSSDITKWSGYGTASRGSAIKPLVATGTSESITSDGSIGANVSTAAGAFNAANESGYVIFEATGSTQVVGVSVKRTAGGELGRVEYDLANDTTTTYGDMLQGETHVISENGPNGGLLFFVWVRYSDAATEYVAGDPRQINARIDETETGNSVIVHHGQVQEQGYKQSPVVNPNGTTSSTRLGELYRYYLEASDGWNEAATLYVEYESHIISDLPTSSFINFSGAGTISIRSGEPPRDVEVNADTNSDPIIRDIAYPYEKIKVAYSANSRGENRLAVNGEVDTTTGGTGDYNLGSLIAKFGHIKVSGVFYDVRIMPGFLSKNQASIITT